MEDHNQTQFSYEKPLFEQPTSVIAEPEVEAVVLPEKKPWYKKPKMLLMIVGAVFLVLLVSLVIILRSVPRNMQTIEPSPTPSSVSQSGPFEYKIKALQEELQNADPAKQDLTFPLVNMEIMIPDDQLIEN